MVYNGKMEIRIVKEKIEKEELARIARENYDEMVKVDVDVKKEILIEKLLLQGDETL